MDGGWAWILFIGFEKTCKIIKTKKKILNMELLCQKTNDHQY